VIHSSIILASHNAGKKEELQAVFKHFSLNLENAPTDWPEVEETGLTFVENALLKARSAAAYTQKPALADDSGIVVPALNGAPGIYSARYSGEKATATDNIKKLLQEMKDVPESNRNAFFYCCLVLLKHENDPLPIIAQGIWPGRVLTEPRGTGGFGYDPIMYMPDCGCTAAELPAGEKSKISHRARAAAQLQQQLEQYYA
jgi:XTP/dITP diphosphohydrolase